MKKLRKKINSFLRKDDAVAGIVVAIMIVGLVIAVISIIQTVYVPKWMEEKEAAHMEQVADQFAQLKFAMDSISVTKQNIPISTPITLGSKELGFLMSGRAFGTLAILPYECAIEIDEPGGNERDFRPPIIKYSSENCYFLDQSYIYEAGAVILSQSQGYVMSADPPFSIQKYDNPNLNVSLHIIDIDYIEGKTSVGGYGTYPVRVRFSSSTNETIVIENITIQTNYPDLWHSFFNRTLSNQKLVYGTNYNIISNDMKVCVKFIGLYVKLDLIHSFVNVQIGPGWVD